VPIGAVGFWLAWRYASETDHSADRRVDARGAALATIALAVFATAVIEAGTYGVSSPWVLGGLGASLVAVAAFVAAEARAANPMLPLSLFRRRGFVTPVTIGFLVNVCFYGLIFLFSLLFQARHRMSALETGLAFLPMTAAILGANLLSERRQRAVGGYLGCVYRVPAGREPARGCPFRLAGGH
jgi:DHA2 family methylenomycin A resistance protein-like MFS transporter